MLIRPLTGHDEQPVLDLTLETFEAFYEGSFRPLMGEVIFAVQHADWREEYARTVPGLHEPGAGKYVDVAEVEGSLAGYVSWEVDAVTWTWDNQHPCGISWPSAQPSRPAAL